jgi:GNAT superfamily N-acetyltransferase
LPGPNRHSAIATIGKAAVGTACINIAGETAELSVMYVAPRYQHRGIGRNLRRYLVKQVSDSNCVEAFVLESSVAALAFYDKLGFCEIGRRSNDGTRTLGPIRDHLDPHSRSACADRAVSGFNIPWHVRSVRVFLLPRSGVDLRHHREAVVGQ